MAIKAVIIKAMHVVKSGGKQVVGEHKDYVNAVASHPETGGSVASVSDDQTCCIWSVDSDSDDATVSFALTSPGMAVCWHPKEPSKVEASAHSIMSSLVGQTFMLLYKKCTSAEQCSQEKMNSTFTLFLCQPTVSDLA